MDRTSLSGLCATCHIETPKYRCPRCSTQTCSLTCFKRHKQRASCSGVRDPTVFVRKSQWATPAGVDHDYNYLKSLERSIDGAGSESQARGIGIHNASSKTAAKARTAGTILEKYLTSNRITVDRAPLGMSRQKNNHTRSSKRGNIIWTVEWIDDGDERYAHHDCPASMSIGELFEMASPHLVNISSTTFAGRKRKRSHTGTTALPREVKIESIAIKQKGEGDDDVDNPQVDATEEESFAEEDPPIEAKADADEDNVAEWMGVEETENLIKLKEKATGFATSKMKADTTHDAQPKSKDGKSLEHILPNDEDPDISSSDIDIITEPSQTTAKLEHHPPTPYFYLFKPGTVSKAHVLIPLDSHTILTTALTDRQIQEYPTIYALYSPPTELPSQFMLETDYVTRIPTEPPAEALADPPPSLLRNEQKTIDADSILKMLRRDVTT